MKKSIKKLTAFILTAALSLCSFNIYNITSADEPTAYRGALELYSQGAVVPLTQDYVLKQENKSLINKLFSYTEGTIQQTIYNGLLNCQKEIDITVYKVTPKEFQTILQDVINNSPDLFYASSQYKYYMNDNKVTTFEPVYLYSGSDLTAKKQVYNDGMNDILEKIDPSWSDLEKIVFVHDYLCQHYEYDTSYSNYDAYSLFATGKGVCQAYTAVFSGIMKTLDIEVSTASSESMGHIWNVVTVDGNWYHLDAVWDDPTTDKFSLASHGNMLVSDTALKQPRNSTQAHHDWECSYTCSSTKYDNYYWYTDNVTSPFKYLNGKWYYAAYNKSTDKTNICAGNLTNSGTSIYTFGEWMLYNSTTSYMPRAYCGIDVYNNTLYFNSCDTIYSYTTSGGIKEFLKPSVNGRLCGLRISNQTLSYSATQDYNATGKVYNYVIDTSTPTPVPTTPTISSTTTPVNSNDPATTAPVNSNDPVTTAPVSSGAPVTTTPSSSDVPATTAPNNSDVPATTAPAGTSTPVTTGELVAGDVDMDGRVTLSDVTQILKAALNIVSFNDTQILAADVNSDGTVNLNDASLGLKLALGIPV